MEITAEQVKELREKTGLGMMICKKALTEADGAMEKAIETLRKQGQATAAKRAGREAKEGKVTVLCGGASALVYEVNSETDFVARNDSFLDFTNELGSILLENKPANLEAAVLLTSSAWNNLSVKDKLLELIAKIGENISFRRFSIVNADPASQRIFTYVHGAGRIGVLVILSADSAAALDSDALAELGKDLAMQVAAVNPTAANRANVPAELVAKERDIYQAQAQATGKPPAVIDKIVDGKLDKFYKTIVLSEQDFIKNPDQTVAMRVAEAEKAANAKISIVSFVRFELGAEG